MRIRPPWLVLVVLLIPTAARAHDHTADIFGAFSFAYASHLWGFHEAFAVTVPNRPNLSVISDLSLHAGTHEANDLTRVTLMGGLRWMFAHDLSQHVPFVHVLVGGVHSIAGARRDTDPALAIGGGYEYLPRGTESSEGWAIRVAGDYVVNGGDGFPRVSGGVVYRFKKNTQP